MTLFNEYKQYRNKLTNIIRTAKNNYYKIELGNNKTDIKRTWQLINEATNNLKKHHTKKIIIKNDQQEIISDNKIKADIFNDYFVNVGPQLASKIMKPNIQIQEKYYRNEHSLFLRPVNRVEINSHINSLKNSGAVGKDQISVKLIKIC